MKSQSHKTITKEDELELIEFLYLEEEDRAIEEIQQRLNSIDDLQELSLKSLGIGVFLGKTKQYANKIDTSAKQLKSYAQKLGDDDLKNCFTSIAELFYHQRKMLMYSTLTSATTGMTVVKQLKKRK